MPVVLSINEWRDVRSGKPIIKSEEALAKMKARLQRFIDPVAVMDVDDKNMQSVRSRKETVTIRQGSFVGNSVEFTPYVGTSIAVFRGLNEERLQTGLLGANEDGWNGGEEKPRATDNSFTCRSFHPGGTLYQVSVTVSG